MLLRQEQNTVKGEVYTYTSGANQEIAWQQALAVLSLDVNGAEWANVGQHDPVIGRLQAEHHWLRPVLFHSPYEAAAAFIIGHRISIEQGRAIRQAMAHAIGNCLTVNDVKLYAFPRPQVLLELSNYDGLSAEKIRRLHGVAEAALAGRLDRAYLRALPDEQALEQLCSLRGVGAFFSQAILYRGAGLRDVVPNDEMTKQAVQQAYGLSDLPDYAEVLKRAEAWRPYRMWAAVLLHVSFRRQEATKPRQHSG